MWSFLVIFGVALAGGPDDPPPGLSLGATLVSSVRLDSPAQPPPGPGWVWTVWYTPDGPVGEWLRLEPEQPDDAVATSDD